MVQLTSAEFSGIWISVITSFAALLTVIVNHIFARQKARDDFLRHQETVASLVEVQKKVEVVRTDVEVVRTDVEVVRTDVDGKMKQLLQASTEAAMWRGKEQGREKAREEQQLATPQINPADAPTSDKSAALTDEHAVIAVTADAAELLKLKAQKHEHNEKIKDHKAKPK